MIKRIKDVIADNQDKKFIFLDIPLLFENNLEYLCDKIIVVYLNEQEEIKRLMKRDNIDEAYAKVIIANQISIEEKRLRADIVLDNNQGLEQLYTQIEALLKGR